MATSDSPLSVPDVTLAVARAGAAGALGSAQGVTGNIADGEQITIQSLSGESFGINGPNVVIYHDGRNGVLDQSLQTSDAANGSWATASGNALYKSGGRVRPLALQITAPDARDARSRVEFSPADELYLSVWQKFDQDPATFSASFKTMWLLDGPGDADRYDLVLLTKTNTTTRWAVAGNVGGVVDETPDGFLSENLWTRASFWLKDNGASEMGYWCQLLNTDNGQDTQNGPNDPGHLMFQRSLLSTSVDRINIMGHVNDNSGGFSVTLLMDGLYIASGPNCRARVEITDTENYADATMTEAFHCIPDSWSDTQIIATVRAPDGLTGKYLHIHDAAGNHTNNEVGRLIS